MGKGGNNEEMVLEQLFVYKILNWVYTSNYTQK